VNEEQLLKDIKDDPHRFAEVYQTFHGKIFGYVYRRTTDYDAAMDITAETFMKAFVNINKFKWREISLLYWLYQIATNELNRYFNSNKYKPASLNRIQEEYGIDLTDHSNAETESIKLQDDLEKRVEFVKVNELIKKLDTKYQDVITLRFFEHKTIKEIAVILTKKEGTIKSLLSRGIEKLKDNLNVSI
jgi:RNA polymerase sigma-70 factor (ECF subfamily)